MAEKDTYRDLYLRMEAAFGRERLFPESNEHNLIFSMVEKLADQIEPENVAELNLVGIREILDGEHDPIIHVSSL